MKLKTAWLCTVLACVVLAVGVNTQAPYKAKHINRAIFKLSDFVLPETFFEVNEFMWQKEYLRVMSE